MGRVDELDRAGRYITFVEEGGGTKRNPIRNQTTRLREKGNGEIKTHKLTTLLVERSVRTLQLLVALDEA